MRVIAIDDHPNVKGQRIEFDIDFETGETSNPLNPVSAGEIKVLRAMDFPGYISFPWQQSYDCPHPLRDPQALAWWFLAHGYRLEGELARYEPPLPDPLPPGWIA